MHTDIQYQAFSRGFRCVDTKRPHASDDWTDKVNVKDGEQVDDVEDNGQGKEAHAPETRHDGGKKSVGGMRMRTTSLVGLRISGSCPQGVSSTLPSSMELAHDTPDAWKKARARPE
jgi:hypothetical protein